MDVRLLVFELVGSDDRRRVAMFVREDKIAGLLNDPGSLGAFLRDLRDAPETCARCGGVATGQVKDDGEWTWECSQGCNP